MNRPKRETKQINRYNPSQQQPRKRQQPIPAIPVIQENRALNLDLPPSQDIKFSKDWGEITNPFWYNNF